MQNKWKDSLSTVGIIIMAPLLALFLTHFVFQSYQVEGPSMEPTLQHSDRLIVSKTGKTWARITGEPYIPDRYEIVIFDLNGSGVSGQTDEKQLIKRIIGLPDDRVVIKDGIVTVYNSEHPGGYLVDREGPQKNIIGNSPTSPIDVTVEPGEVFVMGDNREDSLDSRAFGPISADDIVGQLSLRIYPFDSIEQF